VLGTAVLEVVVVVCLQKSGRRVRMQWWRRKLEIGERVESREGRKTRAAKTVCEKEGSTDILEIIRNRGEDGRLRRKEERKRGSLKLGAWSSRLCVYGIMSQHSAGWRSEVQA